MNHFQTFTRVSADGRWSPAKSNYEFDWADLLLAFVLLGTAVAFIL